jgi:hypothetical protein
LRGAPNRLFISSTVKDLRQYRGQLKDALEESNKGHLYCDLSEDWASPYEIVTTRVKQVLEACEGYYGIFAYYHGWVPAECQHSITRLEFEWACAHFADHAPRPIAVFIPEHDSPAHKELSRAARRLLKREFPDDARRREELLDRQRQFRLHAQKHGTVTYFANHGQLVSRAQLIYRDWGNELLQASRAEECIFVGSRTPTDTELGSLGRRDQLAAFEDFMAALELEEHHCGAIVVGGARSMGHEKFARSLSARLLRGWTVVFGKPPVSRFGADLMASWIMQTLKRPKTKPTVELLADVLSELLKQRSIAVVLTKCGDFQGGIAAFLSQFWRPLLAALADRPRKPRHHFAILLLDPGDATAVHADALQAEGLGRVTLTAIRRGQLMTWLNEHQVADEPPGRRKEIVDGIFSQGQDSLDPELVYTELALAGLWP